MIIYIDQDYKCYTEPSEELDLMEVESDFFDGKCDTFIKSYRYIPEGMTWTRSDGMIFTGEMIAPHTDIRPALLEQTAYENFMANIDIYIAAYNEGVESV